MMSEKIKKLWDKYRVPENIRRHMERVKDVCLFIGRKIETETPHLKVDSHHLAEAAILHDIVKVVDFRNDAFEKLSAQSGKEDISVWNDLRKEYKKKDHSRAGYEILKKEGLPEAALIVKKHGFNALIAKSHEERPVTIEEKILYYADKRVMHDRIVSLAERLHDGRNRYFPDGEIPVEGAQVEKGLYELEEELCKLGRMAPDDITGIGEQL